MHTYSTAGGTTSVIYIVLYVIDTTLPVTLTTTTKTPWWQHTTMDYNHLTTSTTTCPIPVYIVPHQASYVTQYYAAVYPWADSHTLDQNRHPTLHYTTSGYYQFHEQYLHTGSITQRLHCPRMWVASTGTLTYQQVDFHEPIQQHYRFPKSCKPCSPHISILDAQSALMVAITLLIWSEVALFFSIIQDVVLHLVSPDTSSLYSIYKELVLVWIWVHLWTHIWPK